MTITYVQARDALATFINSSLTSAYPALKVFYENTNHIDLDTAPSPFLRVDINFTDTVQADMGPAPIDRVFGDVTFRVLFKEGEGTRNALSMLDFIFALMKRRVVSGVQLETPRPGPKLTSLGWASSSFTVPFWFDSI